MPYMASQLHKLRLFRSFSTTFLE